MINAVDNLSIYASPFGGELKLSWSLQADENINIYVFKSNSAITQEIIDNYFANNTIPESITVFEVNNRYQGIVDVDVSNGVQYYYAVVVKSGSEISEPRFISGVAASQLKFHVVDGKEVVYKAITKMLDNVYANGQKVQLGRDIQIVKNFSIEPIGENFIMLERVNGATMYKFWANEIANIKNVGQIKGDIDVDVIRAIFITTNSAERRDIVYNLFRANKQVLIRLCKKYGAINCDITLEGDYYNPQIHGVNAVGFVVVFNLLITNNTLIPQEVLNNILGEIEVESQQ